MPGPHVAFPPVSEIDASPELLRGEPNPSTEAMKWEQWYASCLAGTVQYSGPQQTQAAAMREPRMAKVGLSAGRGKRRRARPQSSMESAGDRSIAEVTVGRVICHFKIN